MGTRFSDPEHVSPTQNTFLRNFRSSEYGVSEKCVLSGNTFLRPRIRFFDSELVSPKFSEFGVRSSEFRKTCSEWEHVSPTQNTFLRFRTRFSEIFGVRSSEFRKNGFRVGTRFSDSEHVSPKFSESGARGFVKKRVLSGNTFLRPRIRFLRLRPRFSEIFGVWSSEFRSFPQTCSEWEDVSPTQNTFLRFRTRFSEIFEVRSFGKTCSEWEHVSPTQNTFLTTQNTFLRNFRSSEFGVSEKRVLSGNTFLRPRIRFFDSELVSPKFSEFGVRSSEFRKNVF